MDYIANFWNSFWGGLPDVIVAVLVLILAFLCAWIAKKLIVKLAKLARLDKLMAKVKISDENQTKAISLLGNLTYLIVFVLFLPGIFQKLGLNGVADPLVSMMSTLTTYLPNIVAMIVLLVIGLFIAKLVKEITLPLFEKLKIDAWLQKIGVEFKSKISVANILATTLYVLVVVLFVVEALSVLKLEILTHVGHDIVAYLPFILSAAIILFIAVIAGKYVEKVITNNFNDSKATAFIAKVAIIIIGAFIALYQMGIAPAMINSAFVIVLGAIAVAFAIAFGIGGRDFAAHRLQKLEKRIDTAPAKRKKSTKK